MPEGDHPGGEGAESGEQAGADHGDEEDRAPAPAIGERDDHERQQHTDAHRGQQRALGAGAGPELVGGVGERLGDQGAEVAGDGPDRRTAARARSRRGRRPRPAGPTRAPAPLRPGWPAQVAAQGETEQGAPDRHGQAVLHLLGDLDPVALGTDRHRALPEVDRSVSSANVVVPSGPVDPGPFLRPRRDGAANHRSTSAASTTMAVDLRRWCGRPGGSLGPAAPRGAWDRSRARGASGMGRVSHGGRRPPAAAPPTIPAGDGWWSRAWLRTLSPCVSR